MGRRKRKHMAQKKLTPEQLRDMMENKLRSNKHRNKKKYNRKEKYKD